jgi:hypothetical protein
MKKLLSIAFIFAGLMFVGTVTSADAQTWRNQRGTRANQNVRTYTQTRVVWRDGRQYRETYRVQVLRNGRTRSTLISRVPVNNRRNDRRIDRRDDRRGVQTTYQTRIVRENGRRYRVTYKVTRLRNGRTQTQVVRRERI